MPSSKTRRSWLNTPKLSLIHISHPLSELEKRLRKAISLGRKIHFLPPYRGETKLWLSSLLGIKPALLHDYKSVDLMFAVAEMREKKSAEEIEEMERAFQIGYKMHTLAMKMCRPGVVEREIAGAIEGVAKSLSLIHILLRIPIFSVSVVTSICSFLGQMLAMVALPFYLQHEFGYDEVATGLLMTAWPAVIMVVAPMAGMLVERIHAGLLGGTGLTAMAAGLFLLAFLPEQMCIRDRGHPPQTTLCNAPR